LPAPNKAGSAPARFALSFENAGVMVTPKPNPVFHNAIWQQATMDIRRAVSFFCAGLFYDDHLSEAFPVTRP